MIIQKSQLAHLTQLPHLALALICSLLLHSGSTRAQDIDHPIDFERDIMPIFEHNCLHCHGPDEQESGLRVDSRIALLKGGDYGTPALVPGDVAKSLLMMVVNYEDADFAMPPDGKLDDSDIALLTRWVEEGGVWPGQMDAKIEQQRSDHWSFQPVTRPKVPHLEPRQPIHNPVDAFLQSQLAEAELSPAPAADPRTLIRRASVVLTGLPPTPEQVSAFRSACVVDANEAYANLVDDLLASPHFGERWGQHWLDVIRWAETNGSEANLYRKNAWIYRDYVVRSFNQDKPYDQFIREQIAGDALGVGEATGFLVAGPHVPAATVGREPSAIRQARADRMDEIMQTVGASMMGVTIGCARCHNHKFDPVSIKDYYSMTGVFQDIEFGGRFPEFSESHPRRQRGEALWSKILQQRRLLSPDGGWEENWGAYRELHFKPVTTQAVRIEFKKPNLGLDELEVFGTADENLNLAAARQRTKLTGFPEGGTEGRNPIERVSDGEYGTMAWRTKLEKGSPQRPWIQFDFDQPHEINRMRLSSNREYFYDTDYLDKTPYLPRYEFDVSILQNGKWQPWTGTWQVNKNLLKKHPQRKKQIARIQALIATLAEEGPRPSFVGRFVEPAPTFVLLRGSPESPHDAVGPAAPEVLDGDLNLPIDAPGAERRLKFADWISSTENPLTARVMANRIWHHVFGVGIVATTSDFGTAGALPTHPALLEWLAAEFIEPTVGSQTPWSMKRLIRTLVMSHAFRQSSVPTAVGMERDGGAALLWRFPPKRVEAEVIRDSILQSSGSLDRTIGGRSYRIHNIKKTYAQWQVIDNHGPHTWRRLLYQERMRRVDDQNFTAFDFPDCGQIRARRPVSTTPLQALNLMNSDFVVEQSKLIANRALEDAGSDPEEAINRCFQLLLNRDPSNDESETCLQVMQEEGLNIVCRALINSNEFAFLP